MLPVLGALRRAFDDSHREPEVHFHASGYERSPEVCHDSACARPRLNP